MATQQTEDELNLRRKAHRRLVGAVALMLAVVVIMPMVLDREPKPTGQDIELRIPSADKAGEFVPGVPAPVGAENEVSAAAAAEPAPMSAPVAAAPASAVAPVNQVAPAVVAANPAIPPAAEPAKEPVAAPQAEPPVKAQPAADTTTPKTGQTGGEALAVQIGAYSNAETAKQEMLKLKKWGFKAYTEKSGDNYRVRVGPYKERDKVETVRQLLEKHGLHAVVVTVH